MQTIESNEQLTECRIVESGQTVACFSVEWDKLVTASLDVPQCTSREQIESWCRAIREHLRKRKATVDLIEVRHIWEPLQIQRQRIASYSGA
jgi:hypothetical protein